jgi:hypothetical protein
MDINLIIYKPTVVKNYHESTLRAWSVLEQVMIMVDRGDSKETIKEVHNFMMKFLHDENKID